MDYSDPANLSALSQIDPELEELLKTNPFVPANWADLPAMRKMRHELELSRGPNAEEAKLIYTKLIPMRDGFQSEIRIHKPANPPAKSPLIALLFGGGFVVGSNMQLGPYARTLAKMYEATVVTLSYRLAPEHKHPQQPNDAWDSVEWLAHNASSIGADPSAGFVLGGVSAGGNLTAVTAQKAIHEKLSPPLTGLWLCVPVLLGDKIVPEKYKHRFLSREQNANAPVFGQSAIDRVTEYLGADESSIDYSPFNDEHAHTGLPPSYFQVCGMDPLRDDGLIYETVLKEHGVSTKMDVYPGVPHAHFSFLPTLKQSQKALVDTIIGFAWLLKRPAPSVEDVRASVAPPSGS